VENWYSTDMSTYATHFSVIISLMHATPMHNDTMRVIMRYRKTLMMITLMRVIMCCRKIACKLQRKILKMTPTRFPFQLLFGRCKRARLRVWSCS